MSKAEERALEAYPELCTTGKYGARVDWNETKREAYIEGYEQAIQDLTTFINEQKENVGIGLCEYDMGLENGKCELLNAILEKLKQM